MSSLTYFVSTLLFFLSEHWGSFAYEAWVVLLIVNLSTTCVSTYRILSGRSLEFAFLLVNAFVLLLITWQPAVSYLVDNTFPQAWGFPYPSNKIAAISGGYVSFFLLTISTLHQTIRTPRILGRPLPSKHDWQTAVPLPIVVLFFALGLAPYLTANDLISTVLAGRSANQYTLFHEGGLGSTNFLNVLVNSLTASGVMAGYNILQKNQRFSTRSANTFILTLVVLLLFFAGGRTRLGLVLVPLSAYYLFLYSDRITTKKVLYISFLVAAFLLLLSLMVQYRSVGYQSGVNIEQSAEIDLSGNDLAKELFVVVEFFHNPIACDTPIDCLAFAVVDTTNKFLTNPIPRFLWQSKYIDPSFAIFNAFRTGESGYEATSNITPTAIGRYFLLYGSTGVFFISVVFGFGVSLIDLRFNQYKELGRNTTSVIIAASFAYFFAQSVRDFAPGWLYTLIFFYLGTKLSSIPFKKKQRLH